MDGYDTVVVIGGLFLYFIPTLVALSRKHRQKGLIFVLNLLLGWSVFGWIGTLIWASKGIDRK